MVDRVIAIFQLGVISSFFVFLYQKVYDAFLPIKPYAGCWYDLLVLFLFLFVICLLLSMVF